ncbi:LTA synthase family protein [Telmatospirillum sp. J64-1]|uniref:LTA synthase family protein n=1 Tax=Telmatospirillum sp. J64-1 TaxID=2502183 RepID=UPI001C8FA1C7|nr:LTA synthase family protein [Telmatospirillum sp. J64-1]
MVKYGRMFLFHWGLPLAAVAALYGIFQWFAERNLGVALRPEAIPADLTLHLILAVLLRALSRNLAVFLVLATVLMALLHLGNPMKIAILGGPLMPDDAGSLPTLMLLLEGGWLVLGWLAIAALTLSLLAAITLKPWRARIAALGLAGAVAAITLTPQPLVAAMDKRFGNIVWDQHGNYIRRGPLVHILQETTRHAARRDDPPHRGHVLAASQNLMPSMYPAALPAPDGKATKKAEAFPRAGRNVHMIVLESFWDPSVLKKAGLSQDPFAKEFRALWDATGKSRALSPVFGGYTANAEFEALCGFPVTEDAVFFEGRLRNEVPCLPRTLGGLGYETVASHPNVAVFWNRVNAYKRIGFGTYWSAKDFQLDDMNGEFLGDASLYRQVMEKVEPMLDTGTPVFNYVLTFFGHLDYPLNDNRPPVITAKHGDQRLALYANTVHYKTLELMDLLKDLRARDPDGIIVIFGDHLPFLGPNFENYTQSGVLARSRSEFTDKMFVEVSATPLIVIDGRQGPLRLGDMPMYQLPSLILELLDRPVATPMDLTRTPKDFRVRPLPGMHVVQGPGGETAVCRGEERDPALCEMSSAWLDNVRTIGTDLFSGRQHVLRENMLPPVVPAPEPVLPPGPLQSSLTSPNAAGS